MPLLTIPSGNVASGLATGYDVANSCRFNSGDSPSLKDGDGSAPAGNRQKFTFSVWFKRAKLGVTQMFAASAHSSSDEGYLYISGGDVLVWHHSSSGMGQLVTTQKFRDVGAWSNLVWSVDTTQSTASNRMKFFLNGTQITSFSTETYPDEDKELYWNVGGTYYPYIGRRHGGDYWDGYLAEIVHIDNAQLDADSFGEFDSDSPRIWKPKDVSGLTFGTAGYHLDFEDSSALGKDVSGQGNHFGTVAGLAAIDQSTDTCTNNFATMNSLDNFYGAKTFSEGNLQQADPSGDSFASHTTIGVSSGKWYAEAKLTAQGSDQTFIGVSSNQSTATGFHLGKGATSYGLYSGNGKIYNNNDSGTTYGDAYTTNDIISIFLDLDNNKLYFAKNGSLMNSGTGHSITAASSTDLGFYFFSGMQWDNSQGCTWQFNFGSPIFSISSGNTDGEYGNFEYSTTITGDGASKTFKALNTKNLAEYG